MQLPNWTEFPVIAAALSRIGAILVPIMTIYREEEVAYALRHSGAVAAVTCHEFRGFGHLEMFSKLRFEASDLRAVYVARPPAGDASESPSLDSLVVSGDLAALEEEAGPDSSPDDGFAIVYNWARRPGPRGASTPSTRIARARRDYQGSRIHRVGRAVRPLAYSLQTGQVRA